MDPESNVEYVDTGTMRRQGSFKDAQAAAMDPEKQKQVRNGGSSVNLLSMIVSLAIYYNAGEAGKALPDPQHLAGWHFLNGYVSLAQFSAAIVFGALAYCAGEGRCGPFIRFLDGLINAGTGIFLLVWLIMGSGRLWATTPCGEGEQAGIPCTDSGLFFATQGWFIFIYVMLGLVVCCCCCTCCFLAGAAAAHGEKAPLKG